jgi:sister-chromatid-cohesion protein PDS5
MAPRRGAAAAAEPVEEDEPQLTPLAFDEPLSWRAGKAIPTTELLRRLDVLSKELKDMNQELVDKDSLTKVAKELAGQNLLGHKDRGVRAFTACCLVDILCLSAPDAPFTPSQLKVRQSKLELELNLTGPNRISSHSSSHPSSLFSPTLPTHTIPSIHTY